jgi:hypothetical protein
MRIVPQRAWKVSNEARPDLKDKHSLSKKVEVIGNEVSLELTWKRREGCGAVLRSVAQ